MTWICFLFFIFFITNIMYNKTVPRKIGVRRHIIVTTKWPTIENIDTVRYGFPVCILAPSPLFESVSYFVYGRQRMDDIRHRINCHEAHMSWYIPPWYFHIMSIVMHIYHQGYIYHKLRKTCGKFFRSYSDLLSKFGEIPFQEYVTEGISHPVFYGDLVYKLRRVWCERISSRRALK